MGNTGSNMQCAIDALNTGASVPTVDPNQLEMVWNLWFDLRVCGSKATDDESFQAALANVTALDTGAISLAVYIRSLLLKEAIEAMRVDVNLQPLFFEAAANFPFSGTEMEDPQILLQRFRKALEAAAS